MDTPSGKIKRGETINVYTDPITRECLEGEFVPTQFVHRRNCGSFQLEDWFGHFYGEEMIVSRTIRVPPMVYHK